MSGEVHLSVCRFHEALPCPPLPTLPGVALAVPTPRPGGASCCFRCFAQTLAFFLIRGPGKKKGEKKRREIVKGYRLVQIERPKLCPREFLTPFFRVRPRNFAHIFWKAVSKTRRGGFFNLGFRCRDIRVLTPPRVKYSSRDPE